MTDLGRCPGCTSEDVALARSNIWRECDLLSCRTCRTEFLAPQPSDERLGEIYGADYYTPWSVESAETVDTMKRLTFQPMLEACIPADGRTVLDLGCATGSFLAEAARRGASVYGIDLNPEAIAMARTRVPSAKLHVGVAADRPFGVTFDAVVMIDFIEHVRDPEAELSVVHDITHPGSRLVISTPRVDSFVRAASGRHWPQYREEHLTYFSRGGLGALLRRSRFDVVDVRPTMKAITLAYAYGQAKAYPVPLLSEVTSVAYRALPGLRHCPLRVAMGEMTVVAERLDD
jgi:SAM-dependent methyltransferase